MILSGGTIHLEKVWQLSPDVLIFSIGYESRSSAISSTLDATSHSTYRLAFGFEDKRILSFEDNIASARRLKSDIWPATPVAIRRECRAKIEENRRGNGDLTVVLDISSMTREMIACCLVSLGACLREGDRVCVAYCTQTYREPSDTFLPISGLGPVIPELSGTASPMAKPVGLVLGVGYEYGRAVGLINYLEPSSALCWWAASGDPEFETAVRRANNNFSFGLDRVGVLRYNLYDPLGSFIDLESSIFGMLKDFRVVAVPLGPKIFASIMMLAAVEHEARFAIWRLKVMDEKPVDSIASSTVIYYYIDVRRLIDKMATVNMGILSDRRAVNA